MQRKASNFRESPSIRVGVHTLIDGVEFQGVTVNHPKASNLRRQGFEMRRKASNFRESPSMLQICGEKASKCGERLRISARGFERQPRRLRTPSEGFERQPRSQPEGFECTVCAGDFKCQWPSKGRLLHETLAMPPPPSPRARRAWQARALDVVPEAASTARRSMLAGAAHLHQGRTGASRSELAMQL